MSEKPPIEIPPRATRGTKMPFQVALMKIAKPFADMQVSRYRRAKDAMAKSPDKIWLEIGKRKLKVLAKLLKGKERETPSLGSRRSRLPTAGTRKRPIARSRSSG